MTTATYPATTVPTRRGPAPALCELHVLKVNTTQSGGGAAEVGTLLGDELARRGCRVNAYVASDPDHRPDRQRASHWQIERCKCRMKSIGLPDLLDPTSFLWRCRPEYAAADVIHLHNLHGDYLSLGALPLWGWDKPLVWTLHDLWPVTGNCGYPLACDRLTHGCGHCPQRGHYPMGDVDRSRFYRWLKPRLFAAAQPRLVTPSDWHAREIRRDPHLARLPIRTIPNPIATDVFAPCDDPAAARAELELPRDAPVVILAGVNWSDPRKGMADGVSALRQAAAIVKDLHVLTFGGTSAAVLQAGRLPGRALAFTHDRQALARAYAAADVCLFPSHAETCGLIALESQACGTPVVAYDNSGIAEQVEHGATGWLAPIGRTDELAAGIIRMARNPAATADMGRAGRALVTRRNAVDTVVTAYLDEYRRAVADWRRRRQRRSPRFDPGRLSRWLCRRLDWDHRIASLEETDD